MGPELRFFYTVEFNFVMAATTDTVSNASAIANGGTCKYSMLLFN